VLHCIRLLIHYSAAFSASNGPEPRRPADLTRQPGAAGRPRYRAPPGKSPPRSPRWPASSPPTRRSCCAWRGPRRGLATGCALGALSAALTELSGGSALGAVVTSSATLFGLAAGGLGSSALVQYGPSPLRLVYWLIIAGLAAGAVVVGAMRETGERRPGSVASLRPVVGVPPEVRPTFAAILPSLVALWALTGFYLSLAPGLIGSIEGSPNRLWGGAAVFCICFSGGAAVVFLRDATARTAMLAGCVALFAGVVCSRRPK